MQNQVSFHAPFNFIQDLSNAINGEFTAIHFYDQLAKLAPNDETKSRILEIRKDEIRHFQGYSSLYTCLTGHQPSPQLVGALPTNFNNGLRAAFHDEQEAVEFYLRVARQWNNPFISDQFRANASDEQNHAVWFLYFMNHL